MHLFQRKRASWPPSLAAGNLLARRLHKYTAMAVSKTRGVVQREKFLETNEPVSRSKGGCWTREDPG